MTALAPRSSLRRQPVGEKVFLPRSARRRRLRRRLAAFAGILGTLAFGIAAAWAAQAAFHALGG